MNTDNSNHQKYALITGASAGIGKAFAEELARKKHNLLLIALPGSGLENYAKDLSNRQSVDVHHLCVDLTAADGPARVKEYTDQQGITINFLINNAGIGYIGAIEDYSIHEIDEMILLNIRALTLLTRYYISDLRNTEKGLIINLGSFGSYMPSPYKSIYIASKAYVYYFSEAIRREMADTGVKVLTLMPGPINTNSTVRARIQKAGFVGQATVLEAEAVVREALDNIDCRSGIIHPGRGVKITFFILGSLPFVIVNKFLKRVFHSNARG